MIPERDQRIIDWAHDQAGGTSGFTLEQARDQWQRSLALTLLRRGFTSNDLERHGMLGSYLPGDTLPQPEKATA